MSEAIAAMWKDVGVNVKVEVIEYSVRAQKNREKSFKGVCWSDPDLHARRSRRHDVAAARARAARRTTGARRKFDELGNAARFCVDEKFRGEAYKEMTKIFLENLPWLPGHPALRGLRAAEVRGVHAEPEPAVRDPALQLQVPPRVDHPPPSPRPLPGPPGGVRGDPAMRGFVPFLGHRLFRALIALWLVSTVVFVVMRLSGDPGAAAAAARRADQRDHARAARARPRPARCPCSTASSSATSLRGDFGRSIHFREPAFDVVRGYLGGHARAGPDRLRARRPRRRADRAALGHAAELAPRPRRDGPGPGRPVARRRSSWASCSSCCCRSRPTSSRPRAAATGRTSCCPRSRWAPSPWPPSRGSRAPPCWRCWAPTTSAPRGPRAWRRCGWWPSTRSRTPRIPIVTITGLQFGTLLGGAVVTETVFSWPGIGRLAVQSIYNRDYPVVQCTVFLAARDVHRHQLRRRSALWRPRSRASAPAERGPASAPPRRAGRWPRRRRRSRRPRGWRWPGWRSWSLLASSRRPRRGSRRRIPIAPVAARRACRRPTLEGPDGRAHLLGTDHLGRDVLSRVIYGSRVSLVVGFSAVVVGGLLGADARHRRGLPARPDRRRRS